VTVKTKSLSCPNCCRSGGAAGFGTYFNVVCPQCLSVLDATTPEVQLLQPIPGQGAGSARKSPLGSRAKIRDTLYESLDSRCARFIGRNELLLLGRIPALQSL